MEDSIPQTKTYEYETTHKNGTKGVKCVTRKYVIKKETINTLQNKENKQKVKENISKSFDDIMKLPERKRMSFIKNNCFPPNVTSSYNTVKAMWREIIEEKTKIEE